MSMSNGMVSTGQLCLNGRYGMNCINSEVGALGEMTEVLTVPAGAKGLIACVCNEIGQMVGGVTIEISTPDQTMLNSEISNDELLVHKIGGQVCCVAVANPAPGDWRMTIKASYTTTPFVACIQAYSDEPLNWTGNPLVYPAAAPRNYPVWCCADVAAAMTKKAIADDFTNGLSYEYEMDPSQGMFLNACDDCRLKLIGVGLAMLFVGIFLMTPGVALLLIIGLIAALTGIVIGISALVALVSDSSDVGKLATAMCRISNDCF